MLPSPRPSTSHAAPGDALYDRVEPAPFPEHRLRFRNRPWGARVGLGHMGDAAWIAHFGRFEPLPGSFETPLAVPLPRPPVPLLQSPARRRTRLLFAQLHDLMDAGCSTSAAELERALGAFEAARHGEFASALLRRLGLRPTGTARDAALARSFWIFLQESKAPFEQAFFDWHGGLGSAARASRSPAAAHYASAAFAPVREALDGFEVQAPLGQPYFAPAAPCTMLIDEVEAIWAPIAAADDWSAFEAKLAGIAEMAEAYGTAPAMP